MNEREKLLRSIARTERKLARMRARLDDEMRTADQIKKDIEASEKALQSSQMDVARWQKLQAQLRAELAALPAEPVRLRVERSHDGGYWIYPAGSPVSIAQIYGDDCEASNVDPDALAAYICRYGQPDPNAAALKAADALADALQALRNTLIVDLVAAYRAARGVVV